MEAGFSTRIFLSNDWTFGASVWRTGAFERLEAANPDGMLFITRKAIPYLKEIGVTDQAIRAITVDNPRQFFARG
jgi:predicted metal-dependent phosphotriesterase family hydrolase